MGKISPVSAKYIVHSTIEIEGIVDKPDVIGAIFGQTEGLLGADLELRELQRSGRIGRIEVNSDTRGGKTQGAIIIPSSLDKAETAIVAAALEIIQRIGPCNAKIKVDKIEDVRVSKRKFVIDRAKELLKNLMDTSLPDSQELADEVSYSVRVMEATEYGKDRLPAGPMVDDSDEIIVVEGRADVLNLLKHGFKNVIAINGTSIPETIIELSSKKTITAFVDGDRGGDLILKELVTVAEIDFVTKAMDGKEVEEITKKEIHKALRSRIAVEQIKMELAKEQPRIMQQANQSRDSQDQGFRRGNLRDNRDRRGPMMRQGVSARPAGPPPQYAAQRKPQKMHPDAKKTLKEMSEDLIGTRGAYILDEKLNILGKVPFTELSSTLKSLNTGVYAIVFDGSIDKQLVLIAERLNVSFLIGMENAVRPQETKIELMTLSDLE
ncbi:MAG: DNA primase [archaeon GW2011_AR3]|nr:MAG: DNA primase [archaeon GW2011_AR3]MBS3110174.1 DNA primase [Candidatus Woesearchaeota archaeon]